MLAWLQLFRIVNLPTVPGDVLVGAAAMLYAAALNAAGVVLGTCFSAVIWASLASCLAYLYGLADNDIVGAAKDGSVRPIPRGDISLGAARVARGLLWGGVVVAGALGNLPPGWWVAMLLLFVCIIAYNRTKWSVVMGLCRGLNVLAGVAAVLVPVGEATWTAFAPAGAVFAAWTLYIAAVTAYSKGEETNPSKRVFVGFLVGAIVYLQLLALVIFSLLDPSREQRCLLVAGGALLVLLRSFKGLFPKVSAS